MKIYSVLRSGGDYTPAHVERLQEQVWRHAPQADFVCLTDMHISTVKTVPLRYNWRGWWSKMELFRPEFTDKIVYLDLDTTIVGDLRPLLDLHGVALMRDVYRPHGLQSSIMVIPEIERPTIWNLFRMDPEGYMERYRAGGDQAFLEHVWDKRAQRIQDILPNYLVSYKADKVRERGVPAGTSLVIFHGKPRPWEVGF